MAAIAQALEAMERRRTRRRAVSVAAWIDTPGRPAALECKIQDYSVEGAKLVLLDDAVVIPSKFLLRVSSGTANAVDCQLQWRNGSAIGVKFLKRMVEAASPV